MTNREMAEAHLRQARAILIEARDMHARGVWNLVVRRAQEAVELPLKAALRWAGVEVPRVHDVGDALVDHQSRFPAEFRAHLDRFVAVSRRLGRERERSFYGDEAPPARRRPSMRNATPTWRWRTRSSWRTGAGG